VVVLVVVVHGPRRNGDNGGIWGLVEVVVIVVVVSCGGDS
jgi:hypothetical protein